MQRRSIAIVRLAHPRRPAGEARRRISRELCTAILACDPIRRPGPPRACVPSRKIFT